MQFATSFAEEQSHCITGALSATRRKQGRLHEQHHSAYGRRFDKLPKIHFLKYVDFHAREDKWSLDACFVRPLQSGKFCCDEVVYSKTLYNYVELGLMKTRNHHLPEKLRRGT